LIEIKGPGAGAWLDGLIAGRIPQRIGRVGLGYTLTEQGNVLGEATLAVLGEDHYWWGSAAAAEHHDMDWLVAQSPPAGVTLSCLTRSMTALVLAGPSARDVLRRISPRTDWSSTGFAWLRARSVSLGAARATAMSVSYSGEQAWELHIPNESLIYVHDLLRDAGAGFELRPFGLYAAESMRIEKGYRHWKVDLITEFTPLEAGLDRFVTLDKQFVGRAGLLRRIENGPRRNFVSLVLDCTQAPAHGGDSIMLADQVIGSITSASWGHRTGLNLAMGYVDPAHSTVGQDCTVQILGRQVPARVAEHCHYDPGNEIVRS